MARPKGILYGFGMRLVLMLLFGLWAGFALAGESLPRFRHADPLAKPPVTEGLGPLRFVADADFPPFSYLDSSGQLVGISLATAQSLCEGLKLTCSFAAASWSDMQAALAANQADVLLTGLRLSPQNLERMDFTRPYYRSLGRFAVKAGSPLARADGASLAGKRLGAVKGSAHAAYLTANFSPLTLVEYADLAAAQKGLAAGETDALFADAATLIFWMLSPASDHCCKLLEGAYLAPDTVSPGLSMQVKRGNRALLDVLDHGLDEMDADGRQAAIFKQYFPVSPW